MLFDHKNCPKFLCILLNTCCIPDMSPVVVFLGRSFTGIWNWCFSEKTAGWGKTPFDKSLSGMCCSTSFPLRRNFFEIKSLCRRCYCSSLSVFYVNLILSRRNSWRHHLLPTPGHKAFSRKDHLMWWKDWCSLFSSSMHTMVRLNIQLCFSCCMSK